MHILDGKIRPKSVLIVVKAAYYHLNVSFAVDIDVEDPDLREDVVVYEQRAFGVRPDS